MKKNYIFIFQSIFCVLLLNFLLFNLLLILKRTIKPEIIFYEGILCAFISTIFILFLLYLIFKKIGKIFFYHYIYSLIISFLLIILFHTTIITIVDRSISVFMLNKIHNNQYNKKEINELFTDYFSENAIDKRLNEQIRIKNIQTTGSNKDSKIFEITKKGKFYIYLFQTINKIYILDKKIIGSTNQNEN